MSTLRDVLQERGDRYGDFSTHAHIAQCLQDVIRNSPSWSRMNAPQRQALITITDKIARICNGDPDYDDSWRDVAGYAQLVVDRLQ